MHQGSPLAPPRIGVRVGGTLRPAVPVSLGGQAVAVMVDPTTWRKTTARLRLDWGDGRFTELDARLTDLDRDSRVAHLDIYGVAGDWRPFLEYLGSLAKRAVAGN